MKFSRRDLLVWGAGAAAGLVVTPVPWKLLDDTSKWTQNWPWIPQPARGPVEVKQSSCTLCPNGCGLRVRMSAGWPVGVAGIPTHPITRGALCPLAFGAHQLNWHPERLRTVRHHGATASWADARVAFAKACEEGPVIVIDAYPGRAASAVLDSFAQKKGEYRVARGTETRALAPYEKWSGIPAQTLGYDLENSRTIVSFGTPLLDGWGVPGRLTHLWADRAAGKSDSDVHIIQVEPSLSRTASRAYRWIVIHPGSEAALVSGIARVLLEERLVAPRGPMPQITLAEAASHTGLGADAVRDLARTIVSQLPAVVIANDDNPAIAALNVLVGAVGSRGGIIRRSKTARMNLGVDGALPSARAVVVDSSVPWQFVPQSGAEVFRFAAWNGGPNKADWLLPAPGFLEELTDVPTAPTAGVETYAVAPSLTRSRHEIQSCAEFLSNFDRSLPSVQTIIHERCAHLFRERNGTLYSREEDPVAKIASLKDFEEQLRNGRLWVGEPASGESIRCVLKQWPAVDAGSPPVSRAVWTAPVLPPLASKLYQESNLWETSQGRNA